jgi:hypothetical protein
MAGPYLIGRIDMFTRFIMASAVSVTLAFSSAAFAASTDFIDKGHYTTDTISGLDWLDLTQTTSRSYTYVSGKFGAGEEFEGWHYATGTEFNAFVSNYTGVQIAPTYYGGTSIAPLILDELMQLVGIPIDDMRDADRSHGIIADTEQQEFGPVFQRMAYLEVGIQEWFDGSQTRYGRAQAHDGGFNIQPTASRVALGSYLVRDTLTVPNPSAVPIPAAAFMFAPALLGFMGLRRRAKNLAA